MPGSFYSGFSRRIHNSSSARIRNYQSIGPALLFWFGWIYQVALWLTLLALGFYAWNGSTISYFAQNQTYLKRVVGKTVPYHQVYQIK